MFLNITEVCDFHTCTSASHSSVSYAPWVLQENNNSNNNKKHNSKKSFKLNIPCGQNLIFLPNNSTVVLTFQSWSAYPSIIWTRLSPLGFLKEILRTKFGQKWKRTVRSLLGCPRVFLFSAGKFCPPLLHFFFSLQILWYSKIEVLSIFSCLVWKIRCQQSSSK